MYVSWKKLVGKKTLLFFIVCHSVTFLSFVGFYRFIIAFILTFIHFYHLPRLIPFFSVRSQLISRPI